MGKEPSGVQKHDPIKTRITKEPYGLDMFFILEIIAILYVFQIGITNFWILSGFGHRVRLNGKNLKELVKNREFMKIIL